MILKANILIVEDDKRIHNIIVSNLLRANYQVLSSYTFKDALSKMDSNLIHIACLDLILPDGNGASLCRLIKEKSPKTKVIILSKKSQVQDRVNCFECGSDDYLPKPFFPEELVARINRFYKTVVLPQICQKGELELNLDLLTIKLKSDSSRITRVQSDILYCLISNSFYTPIGVLQEFTSRNNTKFHSVNSLKVAISRLRKKFKDEWGRDIIKAKYGLGYYLSL